LYNTAPPAYQLIGPMRTTVMDYVAFNFPAWSHLHKPLTVSSIFPLLRKHVRFFQKPATATASTWHRDASAALSSTGTPSRPPSRLRRLRPHRLKPQHVQIRPGLRTSHLDSPPRDGLERYSCLPHLLRHLYFPGRESMHIMSPPPTRSPLVLFGCGRTAGYHSHS